MVFAWLREGFQDVAQRGWWAPEKAPKRLSCPHCTLVYKNVYILYKLISTYSYIMLYYLA